MSEYGNYGKAKGPLFGGRLSGMFGGGLTDAFELLHLSLKLQFGKRFWLWPLLPLIWPLFHSVLILLGENSDGFQPDDAQNALIGAPLCFLAIAIGMQLISQEIEQRTLEVCYTVPGGAQRIWLSKLAAALLVLIAAEIISGTYVRLVFTDYPPAALYRALQGAVFCLVLSTGLGAVFKNKMTAGMASVIVFFLSGAVTGMGDNPTRYSPYFNPMSLSQSMSSQELVFWLLQNHLGYAMICVTIVILTFSRAERREIMLSDD
jgi:ABC-type transport system involved in multi-copper enzyme maturation permease subunit